MDEVAYTEMMGHRQAMYLARISTLEAQLKDAEEVISLVILDRGWTGLEGVEARRKAKAYRTKYGGAE